MDSVHLILVEPEASYRSRVTGALRSLSPSLLGETKPVFKEVTSIDAMEIAFAHEPHAYALAIVNLDAREAQLNENFWSATFKRNPLVAFVCYSASDSLLIPRQAFEAGASGFFRRDSPPPLIAHVVEVVLGGEAFALPAHLKGGAALS